MKRTILSVACLACLALTACGGGGDSSKKPLTKRDQSNAPKFAGASGDNTSRVVEGPDSAKKP